jgi:hypothetical protein
MNFTSDIDIDMADRSQILSIVKHIPAAIRNGDSARRHNTGVYVTEIPYDPLNECCAIDYREAEKRGYVKLDLLNVGIYRYVRDEYHLVDLMFDPPWDKLYDREFFELLIHVGKHWDVLQQMPQPIDSVARLAMFLGIIRPAKRHLIGKLWSEVATEIWKPTSDGYWFKKSHSIAYAHLVVVHINLLMECYQKTEGYDLSGLVVNSGDLSNQND